MLERLARDKHSSLILKSVNYGRKKFYSTGSRVSFCRVSWRHFHTCCFRGEWWWWCCWCWWYCCCCCWWYFRLEDFSLAAASATALRAASGIAPYSVMAGDDLRRAYMLGFAGAGSSDGECDVCWWLDDDLAFREDF
jgi:hypothetical protein